MKKDLGGAKDRTDLNFDDPMVDALQTIKKASGRGWKDLAAEIPMNPGALMKLARGEHNPSVRVLQRIAKHFEWSPALIGQVALYKRKENRRRGHGKSR